MEKDVEKSETLYLSNIFWNVHLGSFTLDPIHREGRNKRESRQKSLSRRVMKQASSYDKRGATEGAHTSQDDELVVSLLYLLFQGRKLCVCVCVYVCVYVCVCVYIVWDKMWITWSAYSSSRRTSGETSSIHYCLDCVLWYDILSELCDTLCDTLCCVVMKIDLSVLLYGILSMMIVDVQLSVFISHN